MESNGYCYYVKDIFSCAYIDYDHYNLIEKTKEY